MKQIVISKCSGRFANQVWMFANVLAFALEHEYQIHAPSFINYANKFAYWNNSKLITVPSDQNNAPSTLSRKLFYYKNSVGIANLTSFKINLESLSLMSKLTSRLKPFFSDDDSLTRLYFDKPEFESIVTQILKYDTVIFKGFMFCSSVEQMQKHGETLRQIFKPQHAVNDKMNWLKANRNNNSIIIGVHIRRSDYKNYRDGKYYYELEIYKKQMQHLVELFADKNPLFFISSDETLDANEFIAFNLLENKNGDAIEDLYSLSTCDYIIAPPSTFSKWASFYGEVPLYVIENANYLPAKNEFVVRYNHYY